MQTQNRVQLLGPVNTSNLIRDLDDFGQAVACLIANLRCLGQVGDGFDYPFLGEDAVAAKEWQRSADPPWSASANLR